MLYFKAFSLRIKKITKKILGRGKLIKKFIVQNVKTERNTKFLEWLKKLA
jgi:hypothetical protein